MPNLKMKIEKINLFVVWKTVYNIIDGIQRIQREIRIGAKLIFFELRPN